MGTIEQPTRCRRRRRAGRRALAATAVFGLVVAAAVTGVGRDEERAAANGLTCNSSWPAAPAGIAVFGATDGALCWAAGLPSSGYENGTDGALGIVDGTVLTVQSGSSGSATVLARDLVSGTLRWQATTSRIGPGRPMRSDGGVVVLGGEQSDSVVGRLLGNGDEVWRYTARTLSDRPRSINRIVETSTVVLVTSSLYRGDEFDEGIVETVALDRSTGAVRWRIDGTALAATETVVSMQLQRGAGVRAVWSTAGVDLATGAVRWTGSSNDVWYGAASADLFFTMSQTHANDMITTTIAAIDAATGVSRWQQQFPNVHAAASLHLAGTTLIGTFNLLQSGPGPGPGQGLARGFDAATGALRWERPGVLSVLAAGADGVVGTLTGSEGWSGYQPGALLDPRQGLLTVLDPSTGATRTTLPRGPWRVTPMDAAVGSGTIVVTRSPASTHNSFFGMAGGVPPFCLPAEQWPEPYRSLFDALVYQAVPPPTAAAYVPVTPARLFDSRDAGVAGFQCPGERLTLKVTGQAGIPATGVTAVALNLTLTRSGGGGFVTAWPAGEAQPVASTINATTQLQTRSNFVVLPVAADGYVSFVANAGGHLVADVAGYFVARPSSDDGRIVAVGPQRLLDTRVAPGAPLGYGASTTVPVVGGSVPADAKAAVVTVTATDSVVAGYVTAWATGTERPLVSNLNLDGPNETAANLAIVPIGADGSISFFTPSPLHLVVDLVAYVTGDGAADTSTGLFVPLVPRRVFDTRNDVGLVPSGWSVSPVHAGAAGIPTDAAAAFLNVTGVSATAVSHVRVWPTGGPLPLASSLNLAPGDTRAAATMMTIGSEGRITYWNSAGSMWLLADAMGYVLP